MIGAAMHVSALSVEAHGRRTELVLPPRGADDRLVGAVRRLRFGIGIGAEQIIVVVVRRLVRSMTRRPMHGEGVHPPLLPRRHLVRPDQRRSEERRVWKEGVCKDKSR